MLFSIRTSHVRRTLKVSLTFVFRKQFLAWRTQALLSTGRTDDRFCILLYGKMVSLPGKVISSKLLCDFDAAVHYVNMIRFDVAF